MTTVADEIFRIVPDADMPNGHDVVLLEIDGQPLWLIRAGADRMALVTEVNRLATHLVRHGLWAPQGGGHAWNPPHPALPDA